MANRSPAPIDPGLLYAWADPGQVAKTQRRHVRWFLDAPGRVLDIGCGRGIFLALLGDARLNAYGVDTSAEAIANCLHRGLQAQTADALAHLDALADGAVGGVHCSHVIEHLPPPQAMNLIVGITRVLAPRSRAVFVTPDPGDLRCFERFWLDPTHVRPYPAKLLRLLLERAGLRILYCGHDPEPSANPLVFIGKLLVRLWFLGWCFRGDLVIVAEKPSR